MSILSPDIGLRRWLVSNPGVTPDDPTIFPLLPGQMLLTGKAPMWSTEILTSSDGGERRRSNWSYPKWRIRTKYEVLRDRPSRPELERLWAFFCNQMGQRNTFGFFDPYDNVVADQVIGIGTGTQTLYQLTRTLGTFTEPVRRIVGASVTVSGVVRSDWTVDAQGRITFATAPAAGASIVWSGSFMFVVRFNSDELDAVQMTRDLWSQEGIELMTVKP